MTFDTILHGDALATMRTLPAESVHCIVTSPPYFGLRDYGAPGQLGLEATPDAYVAALVGVLREARRVLDPFMGAGTVGVVARRHSRHYLGIELNAEYIALAETRIAHERQPVIWTIGASA